MRPFYVMENSQPAPEVISVRYKHIECSVCGLRPTARVGSTGVRFAQEDELADFSETAQGVIARRSVVEHLTEERISGWRAGYVQVETSPKLRDLDTGYYELIIIGHTRGYAQRVGLTIRSECTECGRRAFEPPQEGLVMPEDTWDGSDIFVIDELPGIYVVMEEFRQVIQKHQHTGVEFVGLDEWRDPLGWLR